MIPKTLYELLPTAYLVGGTASATTLEQGYGVVGGILLVVCGYWIGVARERYRVKNAQASNGGWSRIIQ